VVLLKKLLDNASRLKPSTAIFAKRRM